MRISEFDYELPEELIAQEPAEPRDASRLLALPRGEGVRHLRFADLPDLLAPGDLLVLNDTATTFVPAAQVAPAGRVVRGLQPPPLATMA